HSQRGQIAPARQPRSRSGRSQSVHPVSLPPDRGDSPEAHRGAGQSRDAGAAQHQGGHHEDARPIQGLSAHTRNQSPADLSSSLPPALARPEARSLGRFEEGSRVSARRAIDSKKKNFSHEWTRINTNSARGI